MKIRVIQSDHSALFAGTIGEIEPDDERTFRSAQPDDYVPVKFDGLTHPNPSEYKRTYNPIILIKRKDLEHV